MTTGGDGGDVLPNKALQSDEHFGRFAPSVVHR
jgi:hypothetical protein